MEGKPDNNKPPIFFARTLRAGAISSAPYGVYHTNCESPQPFSTHYSFEEAKLEAIRMNRESIEKEHEVK